MLSNETIERLRIILERRTGTDFSFEEAAVCADHYVKFFSVLLEEPAPDSFNHDKSV